MRVSRSLGMVALVVALLAAACGGDGSKPAAQGQEMTVGLGPDAYVAEGPRANVGIGLNVTEPLVLLSAQYEIQPALAERWEFIEPNTWRFFLRRGVTFHDGQRLDAQAVKAGLFDRVNEAGGITIGLGAAAIVDDDTIDFTADEPNRHVPQQIAHPIYGVIAPGSDPAKPVGTGPFRFVEYAPEERLVVDRNDAYWGPKAKLSRIAFRFYPDPQVERLALERGDIDLATLLTAPDVKGLETPGFRVATSPIGAYEAMYANIHKPDGILADVRVRQAVAQAIDRAIVAEKVLEGKATAGATMVPPDLLAPYATLVTGYQYDQSAARRALEDAGWVPAGDGTRQKGGRRLKITLVSGLPSAQVLRPMPVFVQSQLKEVGIDLEIDERPDQASYEALVTSGAGDLYLEQGSQNDGNPGFLPGALFYTASASEEVDYPALFAPGGSYDELIAASLMEVDPDKHRRLVAEALHEIIDVQAVVVPLAGIPGIYGMSKAVQGFVAHPSAVNTRWDTIALG